MPYVDNQGVPINYRIGGEGAPLVLQHGLTQCVEDWYESGYVDALRSNFRLILVDARAHGASGKPHESAAYALEKLVGDVVAVLDMLNLRKAHFWGYSRGGWIGFGMAKYAPERLDRLVIGGQHPYFRSVDGLRQAVEAGLANGIEAFIDEMGMSTFTSPYAKRLRSIDLLAYRAMAQDRPSLEEVLPRMGMPCCLYCGDGDPVLPEVKSASREIRRGTFFSLPGLDHGNAFMRSDLVVPPVARFLRGDEFPAGASLDR
jgi:pimeloyl-ACP methyl ester carboxylesterase